MDFQFVLRTLVFCTINNIMAVLLKTMLVRVSFIQIMQVRVQNKGKSVWKTRYVGDVSITRKIIIPPPDSKDPPDGPPYFMKKNISP